MQWDGAESELRHRIGLKIWVSCPETKKRRGARSKSLFRCFLERLRQKVVAVCNMHGTPERSKRRGRAHKQPRRDATALSVVALVGLTESGCMYLNIKRKKGSRKRQDRKRKKNRDGAVTRRRVNWVELSHTPTEPSRCGGTRSWLQQVSENEEHHCDGGFLKREYSILHGLDSSPRPLRGKV